MEKYFKDGYDDIWLMEYLQKEVKKSFILEEKGILDNYNCIMLKNTWSFVENLEAALASLQFSKINKIYGIKIDKKIIRIYF